MNKDLIYQAIENPAALSQLSTADLERLAREHPWFSTAQVLLAKKYREGNDYRFTDQLHTAAMTSFNRRVLYTFLKKEQTASAPELTLEKTSPAAEPPVSTPIQEEAPLAAIQATTPSTLSEPQEAHDVDDLLEQQEGFFEFFSNTSPAPLNDHSLSDLAEAVMDEPAHAVAAKEDLPLMPVLEAAVVVETSAAQSESMPTSPKIQLVEMDDLDRDILVTALNKSIELEVSEEADEEVESEALSSEADPSAEVSDPYTLWLMHRAGQLGYAGMKAPAETDTSASEEEEEIEETEEESLSSAKEETQGISHGMQRLSGLNKNAHQKDLIDRFIRTEPKITPGKALDYSGTILGKESLEDHGGLVTETMAKLYVAQGKIDKAKKAYKRLIELFPEKSIYFATQLKNLNTKK